MTISCFILYPFSNDLKNIISKSNFLQNLIKWLFMYLFTSTNSPTISLYFAFEFAFFFFFIPLLCFMFFLCLLGVSVIGHGLMRTSSDTHTVTHTHIPSTSNTLFFFCIRASRSKLFKIRRCQMVMENER